MSIRPDLLEQSRQIARAISPNDSPEIVEELARKIACTTQMISDSSRNLNEFEKNCRGLREELYEIIPPQEKEILITQNQKFRESTSEMLNKHGATAMGFTPQIDEELSRISVENVTCTKQAIESSRKARSEMSSSSSSDKHCQKCQKSQSETILKSCSVCHAIWYCGKECQTKDWPRHKKVDCITKR